eukprot:TRINITY_DN4577_c0_g1_i1.p1 TRINITY_DN4577_c0_g1~~TRINITY_DN4577_c0_g1_i1.p1  ORF type:complete len:280 (+),score=51.30 TRINITY_DN4577_c0_g1_i1:45-842(+)
MYQKKTGSTQRTPIMKQDQAITNYLARRDQFVKQVGIGGKGDKIRKPEGNGNSKRTKRSNEDSYGQFHYKAQRRHNIMEPKSIKRKNKNNAEVSKSVKCPKCIKTLKSPSDLELHGCSTPTTSFTPTTKKVEMYTWPDQASASGSVKCLNCNKEFKTEHFLQMHRERTGCSANKKVDMYQERTGSTLGTPILKKGPKYSKKMRYAQAAAIDNYFAGRDQFVKTVGVGKGDKRRKPLGNIGNNKGTKRPKKDSYVDKSWCGLYQSF